MLTEPILVTLLVVETLEKLNIPYFIGGSLATAVHGVARASMDVDLVADIQSHHIKPMISSLGDAFFADEQMIQNSISNKRNFNIIHKDTMFKVDIFPSKAAILQVFLIPHLIRWLCQYQHKHPLKYYLAEPQNC